MAGILKTIPVIHSVNLLSNLLKRKKKRKLIKDAIDLIIGTNLIKEEAGLIEDFDF